MQWIANWFINNYIIIMSLTSSGISLQSQSVGLACSHAETDNNDKVRG